MPQAEQKTKAAQVLIVDDHPAVREALAMRLSAQPDLEVCGEAASVGEALALVAAHEPDVAVIDIALKMGDGIDLLKRLKFSHEKVRAIVWSMYSEDLYAERALRAGAMGYIGKEETTATIVEAIRLVLEGRVYVSNTMTARLLKQTVGGTNTESTVSSMDTLSDRELEVYRLIGAGLKTRDIAVRMHLSAKTIETYRDRIRKKLGLGSGAELVRSALQWTLEADKERAGARRAPAAQDLSV
jgi:DNA-binding NarL/FixJ family response regulator